MLLAALVVGTFLIGNLLGYLVHRLLHWSEMGKLYQDHLHHHTTIYPPDDYLSDTYREPPTGNGQGLYYLSPILALSIVVLVFLGWQYGLLTLVEGILVLKLNAYLHDATHIRGHWLERFTWFHRLRWLHFQHHVKVATNFGIFVWFPDKLFRTYVPVTEKPARLP
jgi:sterol desaturase/sphingolipid hydroxylase (fatty acid hydroxylase superfamily)